MVIKKPGATPRKVLVSFAFPATIWAESVHLVGDFNGWDRQSHPLILSEEDWHITLELDQGKPYRFRYLVDNDRWCNDWGADSYVVHPLGGYDSVINV